MIRIEGRIAGYNRGPESSEPAGPHHLVGFPGGIKGVGAFATDRYTAYPTAGLNRLLTVKMLRTRGWAPFHEVGHQHQLAAVRPEALVEVSVNIYALAVQRAFEKYGQQSQLRVVDEDGTSVWDDAMEALDGGVDDFADLDLFVALSSFEQLRLAYGEKMLTRWFDVVRQQDLPTEGDKQRWQNLVYTTSIASGADLTDFWDEWGVTVTEETRKQVEDLGLSAPTVDLTAIRETNLTE